MVFVHAKFKPFPAELRKKMDNPAFLAGVEKAVSSSPEMRKRVVMTQKRMAKMARRLRPPIRNKGRLLSGKTRR